MAATSLETLNFKSVEEAVTEPPCTRTFTGPQLLALKGEPLKLRLPALWR